MNATELTWGIAGLAAGLCLAMLALWLLLVLDGRRLRRSRRQRPDTAVAAAPSPATATPPPVLLPEPAASEEAMATGEPDEPVSVESVFAEAFEANAPIRVGVEPSPGEWRPAEPRSRQAPE